MKFTALDKYEYRQEWKALPPSFKVSFYAFQLDNDEGAKEVGSCYMELLRKDGKPYWNQLKLSSLQVDEKNRNQGIGTDLLCCLHCLLNCIDPSFQTIIDIGGSESNPLNPNDQRRLDKFYCERGLEVEVTVVAHKIVSRKRYFSIIKGIRRGLIIWRTPIKSLCYFQKIKLSR